jgi:hypothetical protein
MSFKTPSSEFMLSKLFGASLPPTAVDIAHAGQRTTIP